MKDIITYDCIAYQISTINVDGMFETMVFPIKNGEVSGNEVYCFRTFNEHQSKDKHMDVYWYPEKYLNMDAIEEYLKSKGMCFDDIVMEEVKFPFQYLNEYILGNMDYDSAIDSTIEEMYRIIEEYLETNEEKKHDQNDL
jgi:hypothetical protein